MNKILLLLALIGCFSFTQVNAQLAVGTTAPNFTLTDLDGNQHDLQSYLEQGKYVFLDVFAVWCGPCLAYAPSVEEAYCKYGDIGNDSTVFLAIEADNDTNDALSNNGTLTDWFDVIGYPIINQTANFPNQYDIAFFPTIYIINPDGIIVWASEDGGAINPGPAENIGAVVLDDAQTTTLDDNLRAWQYKGILGGCEPVYCGSIAPSVDVQNNGMNEITSFDAVFNVNGSTIQTIPWTGSLASGIALTVNFDDYASTEEMEIEVLFENINGNTDSDMSDNSLMRIVEAPIEVMTNTITVEVRTDQYGDEAYWALLDEAGNILIEGGNTSVGLTGGGTGYPSATPAGTYGADQVYTETFTIPAASCYDFVAVDSYGDGWCCSYGDGYYKISDDNGLYYIDEFGDFGSAKITPHYIEAEAQLPVASFTVQQADNTVEVTDVSSAATEWIWDWGDGSPLVSGQNPGTHVYTANGTYTICLTISNSAGESDICQEITISGLPTASFTYELVNGVLTLTDTSADASTWTWSFGDGETSTEQNPVYTFTADGEYEVCLSAGNTLGENEYCETISASIVGINDAIFNSIVIMPNPASSFVNIQYSEFKATIENINLVNINGQTVRNITANDLNGQAQVNVNLAGLAEGVYFVNFTTAEGYFTKKLTIGQ